MLVVTFWNSGSNSLKTQVSYGGMVASITDSLLTCILPTFMHTSCDVLFEVHIVGMHICSLVLLQ